MVDPLLTRLPQVYVANFTGTGFQRTVCAFRENELTPIPF
jgi:hypothetical protein